MKNRLQAPISKEEFEDCKNHNLNIHKHWHQEEGIVELYILNEDKEELQGDMRDYVSESTSETCSVNVIPIDYIDWSEFVSQAKKGNCLVIPEKPDEDEYQFLIYPKHLREKVE